MIDLPALFTASEGDPEARVSVKKKWLREVWRLLQNNQTLSQENKRLLAENQKLRRQIIQGDENDEAWKSYEENMATIDKGMDGIFGKGGTFEKFFGKK